LSKLEAKFGKFLLDLGKIKTLHPQKHTIAFGYDYINLDIKESLVES